MDIGRRDFIKTTAIGGAGIAIAPSLAFANRTKSSKLGLGFIGLGQKGIWHLQNSLNRNDIEIIAICDINHKRLNIAEKMIAGAGDKKALKFGENDFDYRGLLELKNVDAVIISTPWLWHIPMATDSMRAGKYTGLEVSAATSLNECWDLVEAHEETGAHLMLLENTNYRRDILAVMNMVRQNVFGKLLHFRCAYQHNLRETKHNACLYPNHGIGSIASYANINRGNRFLSLSSHATKARGLHKYIAYRTGEDNPNAKMKWKLGDVITTTINTTNGETIKITHNTKLPHPYSPGFELKGANGLWEIDKNKIYIKGKSGPHPCDDAGKWIKEYDHPLWKKFENNAIGTGSSGIGFFVLNAFIESAKQNIAPPLDVYDAASWSAITPLSEISIANNGEVQDFPDFTSAKWIKRKPYNWVKDDF